MSALTPVSLHFEDSGEWYSLPEWAEYFISVGKQLASADDSTSRIVTAIVVPTRAYCAAFVSLGMVISDAAARTTRQQQPILRISLTSRPVHLSSIALAQAGHRRACLQAPETGSKWHFRGDVSHNWRLGIGGMSRAIGQAEMAYFVGKCSSAWRSRPSSGLSPKGVLSRFVTLSGTFFSLLGVWRLNCYLPGVR